MVCRTNGVSDQRCVGPMVCRTNGVSDQWCVGPMVCRTNGVSDQRCVGPMVCRTNGVWDQWCVGPMVCRTDGQSPARPPDGVSMTVPPAARQSLTGTCIFLQSIYILPSTTKLFYKI